MSIFLVRPATNTDIFAIKKIADANKNSLGFLPRPKINEAIEQKRIFVLYKDDVLAGFLIFRHRKRDTQTTLSDICVSKEWRGQGGGQQLIDALIQDCILQSRDFILLKCPDDLPANTFYKKIGFNLVSVAEGKNRPLNIWRLDIHNSEVE